jgi:regulator of replication initiation timing
MSQKMINELTDRVSVLSAQVLDLQHERDRLHMEAARHETAHDLAIKVIEDRERDMYDAMRERGAAEAALDALQNLVDDRLDRLEGKLTATEAAGRELAQTAEGLLGENKRLRAEVRDLSSVLTDLLVDTKSFSRPIARQEVDDIRIEARNNIEP